MRVRRRVAVSKFQSHAGSIEGSRTASVFAARFGFNPTLVRLRFPGPPAQGPGGRRFNPTLVRLRERWAALLREANLRFNPTLVRLREKMEKKFNTLPSVSIPRWFD